MRAARWHDGTKNGWTMTASVGAGAWIAGAYLWWDADGALAALMPRLGDFAPLGPALPGLLMLIGTAVIGFGLIRLQNA